MKVWITKWALTQGIFEAEVVSECLLSDPTRNTISAYYQGIPLFFYGRGREWHETKESAIKKAKKMRKKKIASLKMQIEKLENMKFE